MTSIFRTLSKKKDNNKPKKSFELKRKYEFGAHSSLRFNINKQGRNKENLLEEQKNIRIYKGVPQQSRVFSLNKEGISKVKSSIQKSSKTNISLDHTQTTFFQGPNKKQLILSLKSNIQFLKQKIESEAEGIKTFKKQPKYTEYREIQIQKMMIEQQLSNLKVNLKNLEQQIKSKKQNKILQKQIKEKTKIMIQIKLQLQQDIDNLKDHRRQLKQINQFQEKRLKQLRERKELKQLEEQVQQKYQNQILQNKVNRHNYQQKQQKKVGKFNLQQTQNKLLLSQKAEKAINQVDIDEQFEQVFPKGEQNIKFQIRLMQPKQEQQTSQIVLQCSSPSKTQSSSQLLLPNSKQNHIPIQIIENQIFQKPNISSKALVSTLQIPYKIDEEVGQSKIQTGWAIKQTTNSFLQSLESEDGGIQRIKMKHSTLLPVSFDLGPPQECNKQCGYVSLGAYRQVQSSYSIQKNQTEENKSESPASIENTQLCNELSNTFMKGIYENTLSQIQKQQENNNILVKSLHSGVKQHIGSSCHSQTFKDKVSAIIDRTSKQSEQISSSNLTFSSDGSQFVQTQQIKTDIFKFLNSHYSKCSEIVIKQEVQEPAELQIQSTIKENHPKETILDNKYSSKVITFSSSLFSLEVPQQFDFAQLASKFLHQAYQSVLDRFKPKRQKQDHILIVIK